MTTQIPLQPPLDRTALVRDIRSVVVKLGTQVLSDASHQLDDAYVAQIAKQVAALRATGVRVTIVSSGALGSGMAELGITRRPVDVPSLQAVAAVGQRRLMDSWAQAFSPLGLKVAQVLLTRDDIDHRQRFLNLRNALNAIHDLGAVPVLNENDTLSTDELVRISFGDNDILAALVCQSIRADALVLLSVVPGVLDENKERVPVIHDIADAQRLLQPGKSPLGRGGMNSKLEAARIVTGSGELLVVAHGRTDDVLLRIIRGEDVGTWFVPGRKSRSVGIGRWLRTARPRGWVVLDDGAIRAILTQGKSLLPAGIVSVEGTFGVGDVIDIRQSDGTSVARGLSNYSNDDVQRIMGKRTSDIRVSAPDAGYDEVVHRDNMSVEKQ